MSDQPAKTPETSLELAGLIGIDIFNRKEISHLIDAYAAKIAAGAYAVASNHVPWEHGVCTCGERAWAKNTDPITRWKEHILALRPQDAIDAWDIAMLEARLDEADLQGDFLDSAQYFARRDELKRQIEQRRMK